MISTSKSSKVSRHIEKRSQTMKVKRIGPMMFKIWPAEKGKRPKIVRFHLDAADAAIECFDALTKSDCPANSCNRLCSHVQAAISELLRQDSE